MTQLHVLTGASAGQRRDLRSFPVSVGRSAECSVALTDPGVFEKHFEIQFSPEGFTLQASPHAAVAVNDARTESALLRNGDIITAGYARIQFWLGAMTQRGLRVREAFVWILIIAVAIAQAWAIWRLLGMARS
jgi:pSer/pThr/pTyr-binding forkhead associated (FHA) protein